MKIQEAARLTGVTERTLRYYDRIGLLRPSGMTEGGYRLYDEDALRRLQQILFFRELGFPLAQIREIMDSPGYDMNEALRRHRLLLIAERDRLNGLIDLAERTLKGENDMSFDAFDRSGIDRQRDAYAEEARRRWGGTDAYAESEKKTAGYGKEKWASVEKEADEIFAAFAALRGHAPDEPDVQDLVARWQAHITRNYYACTKEILAGLGQMYTADERFIQNIDRAGAGTAQLMSDAIAVYCAK